MEVEYDETRPERTCSHRLLHLPLRHEHCRHGGCGGGRPTIAATLPGVVVSREYKYMCSDPGQELIQQDIQEHGLNRVVVASCSPLLHEQTFRKAVAKGGLNPFLLPDGQHPRARFLGAYRTTRRPRRKPRPWCAPPSAAWRCTSRWRRSACPSTRDVLIVGGGIAGIHAALTLANAGKHVYLVEREPTIGGNMAKFDKTFPTLDCAACILTPKMTAVRTHPNITLWTHSEVTQVEGYVGNFQGHGQAQAALRQ